MVGMTAWGYRSLVPIYILVGTALVVAVTSAGESILGPTQAAAIRSRLPDDDGLLLIDLALPANIDPAVADIEGIELRRIEDLRSEAELNREHRHAEIDSCERMVEEQLLSALRGHERVRALYENNNASKGELDAARSALPERFRQSLVHWDLTRLEPYQPEYLAGFRAALTRTVNNYVVAAGVFRQRIQYLSAQAVLQDDSRRVE